MSETDQSSEVKSDNQGQTIIVNQQKNESNGAGVAGFVLALIALLFGWIPIFGWILWLLGLIFSLVGVFKKPKGLAIAGLVISGVSIILFLFIFAGLAFLGA